MINNLLKNGMSYNFEIEKDPFFIQALKDFESLGFIKINKNGVEILDRKGLEKYLKDFGTLN